MKLDFYSPIYLDLLLLFKKINKQTKKKQRVVMTIHNKPDQSSHDRPCMNVLWDVFLQDCKHSHSFELNLAAVNSFSLCSRGE